MQDEILTTDDYWDCECKTDYIHSKEETFCNKCKSYSHEQPDARYSEVVTKILKDSTLLDWPWGAPEPYPYTHPIREIPDHSKVKVKKS